MNTKPISYSNTSSFPNDKYQISCMLTHFFSLQRVIPRRVQQKYFNLIRNKLLDRRKIIESLTKDIVFILEFISLVHSKTILITPIHLPYVESLVLLLCHMIDVLASIINKI
ncbi:hypothetical protein GLOIN_2v1531089 [Rhizophagus irregularis DAOM 181602=DAOM 197198]|uniref:Uncharacterized protein n=1 Tax=Rhizophagus irregularis (strain DAOM 181602 / DAOM 197198 / MUCL 43194) TaxID=747089 RepID=A0A2P4QMW4_RHIID|nr:hypothetical protein GLOIN_2v1657327 [Rhizophagus irregularis DAOM 181602=DAOM 197198]XP_025185848.1 hypothetical protein GLOIN_2v1531089 [Rhizophagus irregularis DAOM 181602=DAOM 197198]POG66368.1 hypothetical protein GLOIN_2v1657327 [Rhizophagus irregularis DAOM 181602=DAOM 197198]POG78982.1 hypothetical protein GLOIN_2v1531089 [Rhizophagus irregularis DAOM 181602=DAOM 197198]|eukprot:XP_025173234.1 hypothetical protein GLOIN_2v1657327 [Rhizophagus irregularis DAOM 181602=DAOM 197198]